MKTRKRGRFRGQFAVQHPYKIAPVKHEINEMAETRVQPKKRGLSKRKRKKNPFEKAELGFEGTPPRTWGGKQTGGIALWKKSQKGRPVVASYSGTNRNHGNNGVGQRASGCGGLVVHRDEEETTVGYLTRGGGGPVKEHLWPKEVSKKMQGRGRGSKNQLKKG